MTSQQSSRVGDGPIAELQKFPLINALFGRRSRRFGMGMEVPPGPLAFKSRHQPVPLTKEEQNLLVAACGISGWNFGIPYSPSTPEAYSNYSLRLGGRTYPTGAGIGSPELFYTDDDGIYMTQMRDSVPSAIRELSDTGSLEEVAKLCGERTIKISDTRLNVPSSSISPHNLWCANLAGSTLFMPVCDVGEYFLATLGMLVQTGGYIYDDLAGCTAGNMEPYIKSGLIDQNSRAPLSIVDRSALTGTAASLAMMGQNLTLMMQAMGLGGWLHTGIDAYALLGAAADNGVPGLGFRFQRDSRWTVPNAIGLDGYYESVCPPYNSDMRVAVRKLADRRFGEGGTYDPNLPGPFRDNVLVKGSVKPYSEETMECMGEIAQYIFDTYGKFPGTIPTMFLHLMVQTQHIDTEFYDTHYQEGAYLETHANHMATWHDDP